MDIAPTTRVTTGVPTTTQGTAGGAIVGSDFQTFLKMLTTQMQNQDPLNPIESSDYAVQLATFSAVEQQVKTNDLLARLGEQMGLMGMAQYANWVGMEARAAAPAWFDGDVVTLAPNPAVGSDAAQLVIYDASGAEVSRRAIPPTTDPINWNGLTEGGTVLPTGLYAFNLESYRGGALIAQAQIEAYAPIIEARGQNGGTVLILKGGAQISTSDVTALRAPHT